MNLLIFKLLSIVFLLPAILFSDSLHQNKKFDIDSDLSEHEIAWLKKNQTVTYVYDPDWAPFEWKNNNNYHSGIIADIILLIKQRTGINFVAKHTNSWAQSIEYIKNGKADMVSAITYNRDRTNYLNFTTNNIYSYPAVLVTKFDDKKVYLDINKDCQDKKIGIVQDSGLGDYIRETYPNLKFVTIASTQDGFEAIRKNRIDLFAINTVTAKYLIEKSHFGDLKVAMKLDYIYHLKMAVHKSMPIELISILDKTLKNISEEDLNAIFNKWTEVTIEHQTDWMLITQVLVFFLIIFFFLLWHNRKLKALVQQKTKELKKLSITDHLTGLLNRRQLEKDFLHESKRSTRFDRQIALYFIDIDNFKTINDQFGHDTGDAFLVSISKSIVDSLRETERVYRIGGDEFCILIPEFNDKQQLEQLALRLIKTVEEVKKEMNKDLLPISCSIGISIFPDNGIDLNTLMIKADKAMYTIKETTKNNFFFTP